MWPTSLRSRCAHVMVSASRRRADHFRWFEEESRAKYRWMGGSESNEDSTDNQRHILIYKGDSSLILQGRGLCGLGKVN